MKVIRSRLTELPYPRVGDEREDSLADGSREAAGVSGAGTRASGVVARPEGMRRSIERR